MTNNRLEMKIENREKMRDGNGIATITHLVNCENEKNVRLIAEVTLPPGASVGEHNHESETEYFLFISGSGLVNDNGKEIEVKAGDAMVTGGGAYHSITNTGNVPLVFHAVIVTY
ncbi:MAG: cupin domain-containing protein [Treponema sp.]|nr:cupin domain-containing protein [Treponema sp.]